MEDASTLLRISKSECPYFSIRPPKHIWPKSWCSMDDPVVILEKSLYGHPLAGLLWERQLEKVINWECLLFDRARELSYQCMWTMSILQALLDFASRKLKS